MDLLSEDVEAIAVKTWFWKSDYNNPETSIFSLKYYDYKDFNTLGLVILTSPKTSDYGKLIIAEECKTDDSTDKIVYRLQLVLTYTEYEKQHSIETEFIKRKDETFYIYYVEDIKISELLKITCTFSELETSFETGVETDICCCQCIGQFLTFSFRKDAYYTKIRECFHPLHFPTGERNVKVEQKENYGASNERTPSIKRSVMDNWSSITSIFSKELLRGFLNEMEEKIVLNVRDQRLAAHTEIPQDPSSTLKATGWAEKYEHIWIADCIPDMFKDFLLYLSTGKVDSMSRENTSLLHFVAKRYDLKLLESKCRRYMEMYCPNCSDDYM